MGFENISRNTAATAFLGQLLFVLPPETTGYVAIGITAISLTAATISSIFEKNTANRYIEAAKDWSAVALCSLGVYFINKVNPACFEEDSSIIDEIEGCVKPMIGSLVGLVGTMTNICCRFSRQDLI